MTIATSTETETAISICVLTAFSVVPKNALIRRCCLIHLKNNSSASETVELGDGEGGQREVVGEKDQSLAGLGILQPDTSQRRGEALVRVEAGERDGLVADEAGASVDRMRVSALGLEVSLGADDEEAAGLMKATEPMKSMYPRSMT